MAAQKCGHSRSSTLVRDPGHFDVGQLAELQKGQMWAGPCAGSACHDLSWVLLGVVHQILDRPEGRIIHDRKSESSCLKYSDGDDLFRFISCIAAFNGLQDNVRNVDAGHEIPVRLLLDHVGPTDGAAAARFVLNDDFLPQYLFQVWLLPPGFQVGLPARGKGNGISDGPGRILLLCQCRHCKRTHAEHY